MRIVQCEKGQPASDEQLDEDTPATRWGEILRGREPECATLDRLLDAVRAGESRVLVLRGEPGVGKTALLDYTVSAAPDLRVLRTVGVESEMELAFASLQQLCLPMLDRLDQLPVPQEKALGVALGLRDDGQAPNRFLIALATLGLLSEAAEEQPLLCTIDDAQWLDEASALTLAFVARRLLAEPVAIVFVTREPIPALRGLPELILEGVGDDDARLLLASAVVGRLDERVRETIISEARGNPLALLELPRTLTPAKLAGGFALAEAKPLTDRIEESFHRRVQSLPPNSQLLLLTAAAEPLGDAALLWRAAARLGVRPDAIAPAEAAALIEVGARVRFRHPLLRSAIYRAATPDARREIHQALAEATDPEADPDRQAWHRAHAAGGLDESVASDLERSAARAQSRGGLAATAAFLERAAELTPDPARRGTRALAAAQAKLDAGAPEAAHELLATGELTPLDELQRARLQRLRAQIAFARRRGNDAPFLLLDAAKRFEPLDAASARETYVEAFAAAIFAGRESRPTSVVEVAEAARAVASATSRPRPVDVLLNGLAKRFTEPYEKAVPTLARALRAFAEQDERNDGLRWLWVACPVTPEPLAAELWDDERWHELASRAVNIARDAGALSVLPIALSCRACVHLHAGEFDTASMLIEEADAISRATGNAPLAYISLALLAWRGQEVPALSAIESGFRDATARGEGRAIGLAHYATAVLYNGLGRYQDALAAAQRACAHEDLGFFGWALIELIEAGARSDGRATAADAMRQLDQRTRASGTDWALGVRARSLALLSDGKAAETLYHEAIERLGRSRIAIHLPRAQLIYGEWLRRENRRVDARKQLRAAHDTFSRIGAEAFAERARHELVATGETARRRTDESRRVLTPQEAQIARLASDGLSNPAIGAQLFISPRTVQYHLHKVFLKLEITSRIQLSRLPSSSLL
jgi:DNA-binding CsgD family transcriptional regulator/tetratricopeptide (TPR) repeat protein